MNHEPTPLPLAGQASPAEWRCPDWPIRCSALLVLLTGVVLLFQPLLAGCVGRWAREPQYVHGFAVPLLTAALVWTLRWRVPSGTARISRMGLALLLPGVGGHVAAVCWSSYALDAISFVTALHGCVLTVFGRRFYSVVWPALMYPLCLMPLPEPLERFLAEPIQAAGIADSVYVMQTLGVPTVAIAPAILFDGGRMDLTEQFSGLRMMLASISVCLFGALVSERTNWERVLILLTSVPLAYGVNLLQAVFSGLMICSSLPADTGRLTDQIIAWSSLPLAGLLLFLSLRIFDWVLVETDDRIPGGMRSPDAVPCVIPTQPRRTELAT